MEKRNNKEELKDKQLQSTGKDKLFWQIVAFISGCAIATQISINGHLGVGIGSTIQASLISSYSEPHYL